MLIGAVAAAVFLLDYFSKRYVMQHMVLGESRPVIPHVFYITYIHNAGAAFGLLQHQTLFFIVVSLVVAGLIVGYGRRVAKGDVWMGLALGLLLGGALGNLVDRVLYGTVVDFLDFRVWPVFNLADSAITAGGVIFAVLLFTQPGGRVLSSEIEFEFGGPASLRLDLFLAGRDELGLSRAQVQRLCRAGRVTVAGAPADASRRLRSGERVGVDLPPPPFAPPPGLAAEAIPLDVVYEDAYLIVVNKPRGLVVHPAPGNPSGTLVNALLAHCPDLRGIGGELRPGVVHRLDKDTTGLMVAAKDEPTLAALAAQIARRDVSRRYLALVHGSPPESFVVDAPIGRDPANRKRMAVRPGEGRQARTQVELRQRFAAHALVEAALETGRTHQIRVHLAFAGFPVLADPVYGRRGGDALGLAGQALHAYRLAFTHPATGRELVCEVPPPPDFAAALERLGAAAPQRG